jgi:hypothetical protein
MLGQAFESALGAAYLADDCHDALRKKGIDVTGAKRLGTGFYGSAYLLKDGFVLKVTEDESEATLAAWLHVNKRNLPTMFPRILSVFQAKCSAKYGAPDYYIVREDLQNTSGPYLDREGNVFDTPYIEPLIASIAGLVDRWNGEVPYGSGESYSDDLLDELAQKYARDTMYQRVREEVLGPNFVTNVIKSLAWQRQNKVFVSDLHAANFGLRKYTNDLVVRDLGMSSTPSQEPMEMLSGFRRGRGLRLKARRL